MERFKVNKNRWKDWVRNLLSSQTLHELKNVAKLCFFQFTPTNVSFMFSSWLHLESFPKFQLWVQILCRAVPLNYKARRKQKRWLKISGGKTLRWYHPFLDLAAPTSGPTVDGIRSESAANCCRERSQKVLHSLLWQLLKPLERFLQRKLGGVVYKTLKSARTFESQYLNPPHSTCGWTVHLRFCDYGPSFHSSFWTWSINKTCSKSN